jgi:hypothetical protein
MMFSLFLVTTAGFGWIADWSTEAKCLEAASHFATPAAHNVPTDAMPVYAYCAPLGAGADPGPES